MAVKPQYLERPRVYTVGEVASALRVSSETIRRKISAGARVRSTRGDPPAARGATRSVAQCGTRRDAPRGAGRRDPKPSAALLGAAGDGRAPDAPVEWGRERIPPQ